MRTECLRCAAAALSIALETSVCDTAVRHPAPNSASLSGAAIIEKMVSADRARAEELLRYTSIRVYRLENKRFHTRAEMKVSMAYQQPGKKEFVILSESGSAAVRKRVLRRLIDSELEASNAGMIASTQITSRNYDFHLVGSATDRGRSTFVFELWPKLINKFMIRGRIWIDAQDYAITRIEGQPAKNPSVWIRRTDFVHEYERFGTLWLAVSNKSRTEALIFGHTTVEIRYSDYRINPSGD